MKTRVFISHSSKDKETAAEVCRFLESNGVTCWIAPRDVVPGKNYGAAIVDAIDECGVFVLILSNESNKSGQVVREVERAAAANAVLIPFRIENVQPSRDLEFYVSSSHWLDASDKSREKHLSELLAAIKSWQAREDASSPSLPASAAPVHASPQRASPRSRAVAIGATIVVVIVVCAAAAYLSLRGGSHSPSTPSSISPARVAAAPTTTVTVTPAPPIVSNSVTPPSAIAPPIPPATPVATTSPSASKMPVIQRVTASSELAPQMYQGTLRRYSPHLAFDHDITTAWIPNKSGRGDWIQVQFDRPTTITSVSIYGGYGVDQERFQSNNRVHQLRMSLSTGFNRMLRLQDEARYQYFELPAHPTVDWIRFEVMSIYPGSKYNSTPISEILFNGPPPP